MTQLKDVLLKNVGKKRNRGVAPKSGAKMMPKGNVQFRASLLEIKGGDLNAVMTWKPCLLYDAGLYCYH
jgi:hypothetical protein